MKNQVRIERHAALSKALSKKVGLDAKGADQLAVRVLNYFGYGEEVIDNSLNQEDRRLFYFLQDVAILRTAWEEAILPSGRTWRIFYWFLNIENIEDLCREEAKERHVVGPYDVLPDDIWSRNEVREES